MDRNHEIEHTASSQELIPPPMPSPQLPARIPFLLWFEQNWIALLGLFLIVATHLIGIGSNNADKMTREQVQKMMDSQCYRHASGERLGAKLEFIQKEIIRNAVDIQRLEAKHGK